MRKPLSRNLPTRLKLSTLNEVRAEMAAIYRYARGGGMAWADATRAIHCLSQIARIVEGAGLENRIAALEAAAVLPTRTNGYDATVSRY